MRLIYTCILLITSQLAFSQIEIPLQGNDVLVRYAEQKDAILKEHLRKLSNDDFTLQKNNPDCALGEESVNYLTFTDTLVALIDTTGFGGGMDATLVCNNCETAMFGVATIENREITVEDSTTIAPFLVYVPNGMTGRETIDIEFCDPGGNCFDFPYDIVVKREGQSFVRQNITLRRGEGQLISLPTDAFSGEVGCAEQIACGTSRYTGHPMLWISNSKPNEFFYGADAFNGVDTVCIVVCDDFTVCDTFINAFTIVGDTIDIPFMDDFSYSGPYPDTSLWLNRDPFVNNDLGTQPPSIGFATFDGLDEKGRPRLGGIGESDVLTSNYLDLSINNDNLFLSFYLQPKGLGDRPEVADNFKVEFKKADGNWQQITIIPGMADSIPPNVIPPFKFYSYPVSEQYLYDGFQFRFVANNGRQGALDLWHLDYVRLESNANSANVNDMAFANSPQPILKNYTAMPWNHFLPNIDNELAAINNTAFFNHFPQINNLDASSVRVIERNSNTELANFSFDALNIPEKEYFPIDYDIIGLNNLAEQLENLPTQEEYNVALINTLELNQINRESVQRNDETETVTTFGDYFAYDDGTAESNIIAQNFSSTAVQVAVEFTANVDDSLQAVQFHFPRSTTVVDDQFFNINIWFDQDAIGGRPDYTAVLQRPFYVDQKLDSLQGFTTYPLMTAFNSAGDPIEKGLFIPAGKFWIGWEQFSPCSGTRCIPVGYDRNTPTASQFNYFNSSGDTLATDWMPFDSLGAIPDGALMIRAVMGNETPVATVTDVEEVELLDQQIQVYPNPTNGILNIVLTQQNYADFTVQVYTTTGQLLQSQSLREQLDLSHYPSGMYFIKILNQATFKSVNHKILVK